jgi:signal transduction histidine kinase
MGMGLSIAHTIVEAHHGAISAENRDHGGTSFRIRLPLVR